jgi:hypothetical protein
MHGARRTAAKRDENEAHIVNLLRRCGATVVRLSEKGIPDLLVGFAGRNYLLEVKLPLGKKGGKNGSDLTDDQKEFFATWRGATPFVVRDIDEALEAIGAQGKQLKK